MSPGGGRRREEEAGLAVVLHELRGPAASIVGAARTLAVHGERLDRAQRRELLSLIDGEIGRIARLVRDLLDATRVARGELRYRFEPVDPASLVRGAAAAAAAAHPATPIRTEIGDRLPPLAGDADRLLQALRNLIDNAVKFSPPGAGVEVRAAREAGTVRIDVRDHGTGIAPEHQARIFERFGRVPGTGKPGSGLGLFVARAVAEAHGGSLTVSSAPGAGATFTLSLPSSAGRP